MFSERRRKGIFILSPKFFSLSPSTFLIPLQF
jgi:hypothetical protein